jgi:hypothetical protein
MLQAGVDVAALRQDVEFRLLMVLEFQHIDTTLLHVSMHTSVAIQ